MYAFLSFVNVIRCSVVGFYRFWFNVFWLVLQLLVCDTEPANSVAPLLEDKKLTYSPDCIIEIEKLTSYSQSLQALFKGQLQWRHI